MKNSIKDGIKLPAVYDDLSPKQKREVREAYVVAQEGLCLHCNEPLDGPVPKHIQDKKINWQLFPRGFLRYPVHLQHDHGTGMTEGAVHSRCNAIMWQYHGR